MSNPEFSLQLFNRAVEAKRQGRYSKAIRLQKESIAAYPEDPDLMQNFYSMGKTYYLLENYSLSIACYKIYNGLCIVRNPDIIRDYIRLNKGDREALQRYAMAFRNLAHNVGHSALDGNNKYSNEKEVLWYKYELEGKNANNLLSGYAGVAEQYDNECIDAGFAYIHDWTTAFVRNQNAEKNSILSMMRQIVES